MKSKFLKKLGIVLCMTILTTTSTAVFANERVSETTKQQQLAVEPRYTANTNLPVRPGQTVYLAPANGDYYLIMRGTYIDVEFWIKDWGEREWNYVVEIIDDKGNIVFSDYWPNGNCLQLGATIKNTGKYKIAVTNYSPDTEIITKYIVEY